MRQTSMEAYKSVASELGNRQKTVFDALSASPKTNAELADYLNWPINCVTPRTGELVEKGMVRYGGVKIGPTGRRTIVWMVAQTQLQFT